MDEQPVQLKADLRDKHPMKPGQVERVDSEYKRNGVVSLFLFTEALFEWRKVSVRERRDSGGLGRGGQGDFAGSLSESKASDVGL